MSKRRSSRLVEKEVEESPEIETKQAKEVVDPIVEEEDEEEEEVSLIRRSSKKPATAKSTTTKSTTPKITTKSTTTKASKPEESEKLEESESDKESEPVDMSEPENQEMEEEEVEKEEVVIVEKAKKVVAQKPSSKAVKSVVKPISKPIPTKPSIKTTKTKTSPPTIAPQPVDKSKKKADADVEAEVPKKETVKAGASKGPRIKTIARTGAESSKGKEIMEQEPESGQFPADKKRKVYVTAVAAVEGSKPKKKLDVFMPFVEEFYEHLHTNDDGSYFTFVKGTPIHLSEKSLAEILKVPYKGLDEYSRENWPTVKGLTAEQIQTRLFTGPPDPKQGYTISHLREPIMGIFHTIASKIVIPRA
ncbi:uncharacterized protein LOC130589972 [Beta vulgaris subsp. vulgaris]|uniref:uncharacterized protein LOC130589972 n=1 Tax=Beta vulgaris subsp. vulgaris TaxID=3555 RepID=UPI002549855B|nr:uncharacterized protein LOC130589972 [Beta vulgaris subsp. vulgaris]